MLTILIITLLFGGPDEPVFDKQTRGVIKQTIAEPARRGAVLDAIKRIEKSKRQLNKVAGRVVKRLGRMQQDPDIGVAEIEAALGEITRARLETQQAFVDGVFEMRRHMRAEEWRAAFGNASSEKQ